MNEQNEKPYDAGDAADVSKAKKREKAGEVQDANDIKSLMESDFGRRFIARLFGFSGLYRSSFTGDERTDFNEGMRNVGLWTLLQIEDICPELYLKLLNERKAKNAK